jgi:hypothetical protein
VAGSTMAPQVSDGDRLCVGCFNRVRVTRRFVGPARSGGRRHHRRLVAASGGRHRSAIAIDDRSLGGGRQSADRNTKIFVIVGAAD